MRVVAPEMWYVLFWFAVGVIALVLARVVLVNPILTALAELKK
jgi:hypothetical protein